MTLITQQMRDAIGATISREVSYPVSASDIRRWLIAIHWPLRPPTHSVCDEDGLLVAPEEFNPFAWAVRSADPDEAAMGLDQFDPDRCEILAGIPAVGLTNQLFGEVKFEYGRPMREGDVIRAATTIAGYTERTGAVGEMLLTTLEDTWTTESGDVVRRTLRTIIRY